MSNSALAPHHPTLILFAVTTSLLFSLTAPPTLAQITTDPPSYGPYNATLLSDGEGLHKPLLEHDSVLRADSPWSLYCWMKTDVALRAPTLLAGIGNPHEEYPRYLALDAGKLILWMGKDNSLSAPAVLSSAKWHFLAATFDGNEFHLYSDGALIGSGKLDLGSASPVLHMAPPNHSDPVVLSEAKDLNRSSAPASNAQHFGGKIASLMLLRRALSSDEIKQLHQQPPEFSLIEYEEGSKPWPVQTRAQAGYRAPQDPSLMPTGKAPFSRPGHASTERGRAAGSRLAQRPGGLGLYAAGLRRDSRRPSR